MVALDLRASGFDQLAVVDAGRARRHARHAAKARIEVADPLPIHIGFAVTGKLHQVRAANPFLRSTGHTLGIRAGKNRSGRIDR